MWRRVLSQSPSEVPKDAESALRTQHYLEGWKALGALLFSGRSLSARERNCCFLNVRGGRFATVSSAVGFDHPSDSRGLAAVDWDMDGDLDVWMTNRTSPRVRYLQNNVARGNHFVAVKLRGISCNRDAIGARVELLLQKPSHEKIIQTLSAGEGFVSQTSKWIHFGLGPETEIDRIVVSWPGGGREEFRGLTADRRFELVQQTGIARPWHLFPAVAAFTPSTAELPPRTNSYRIVLPQRLPLPNVRYFNFRGEPIDLNEHVGRPVLINLWATWCRPCLAELAEWKNHFERIGPDLTVLALNVDYVERDPLAHVAEIKSAWENLGLPVQAGVIDAQTFETFEVVERILTLNQGPLPIPTSFLVDADGKLEVVYKGRVEAEQVLADARSLEDRVGDPRDASVPFVGQWFSDPFPPDLIAIPAQFVGLGRGRDAFDYLTRYVTDSALKAAGPDVWEQLGVTPEKVFNVYSNTGRLLLDEGKAENAVEAFRSALRYKPGDWDTYVRLTSTLIRLNRSAEAIAQSREMTRLRPGHPLPLNNIAWVMATSTDSEVRDAKKAVALAERICQSTGRQEPTALDTLAVAYAAAGRFAEAVDTAEEAIRLANSVGREDVAETIRGRLRLYQAGRAYDPATSASQ